MPTVEEAYDKKYGKKKPKTGTPGGVGIKSPMSPKVKKKKGWKAKVMDVFTDIVDPTKKIRKGVKKRTGGGKSMKEKHYPN